MNRPNFNRFEASVAAIVAEWPKVQTFDPVPLAPTTFRIRLKDALRDYCQSDWSSAINRTRLLEIYPTISISTRVKPGLVVVGPRNALQTSTRAPLTLVQPAPIFAATDDVEHLKALILLHHHHNLQLPTEVNTNVNLNMLAEGKDVEITLVEPNRYIII
jgi:hypothetical protein